MIFRLLSLALCLSAVLFPAQAQMRNLVGYYPSWPAGRAATLQSAGENYTHVVIAFAKPDFAWTASAGWAGTGLQFSVPPDAIKKQIAVLKTQGTQVLLAVGGATYLNWASLAAEADNPGPITASLKQFLADMDLDGIDADYEIDGTEAVQIAEYRAAIIALRRAAAGKTLSLAAWSTGADCTARTGSDGCGGKLSVWEGRAGRERLLFRESGVIEALDMVNVMSYDAGVESYDPVKAWELYRALLPRRIPVQIGFEAAPEGWGGATLVTEDAAARCASAMIRADSFGEKIGKPYAVTRGLREGPLRVRANSNPRDGAMIWHIVKDQALPQCTGRNVASPEDINRVTRALFQRP